MANHYYQFQNTATQLETKELKDISTILPPRENARATDNSLNQLGQEPTQTRSTGILWLYPTQQQGENLKLKYKSVAMTEDNHFSFNSQTFSKICSMGF